MKTQRFLLALCVSLAMSAALTFAMSRHLRPGTAKPESMLTYVGPSRSLEVGEVLRSADLISVTWPKSVPVLNTFTNASDLVGRTVLVPLEKGQPIIVREVSSVGAGAGLAAKVPDGMRAVALRSDEVMGVGGFLNPGSHVDVLVTYRLGMADQPMTATALQNAQVLAAGQKAEPDPAGKPQSVTVVTLLLTPDDAERAVLASSQGSIHFVLRNSSDAGRPSAVPMQMSRLAGIALAPTIRPHAREVKMTLPAGQSGSELEVETVLDGATGTNEAKAGGVK